MRYFSKKIGLFDIFTLLIIFALFFYLIFFIQTDLQLHIRNVKNYSEGNQSLPINFLYYYTIYFFSVFSKQALHLSLTAVFVLTAATFLKYYISKIIILQKCNFNNYNEVIIGSIFSFILLFVFSIPILIFFTRTYYLLSFTPNVWHNSTVIFSMPISLLLFWLSLKQLNSYSNKNLLLIILLVVVNIFIKPSFIFVFCIVYPIILFLKFGLSNVNFWINLLPIIIAAVLIFGQYIFLYQNQGSIKPSSVEINFLYFFKHYSKLYNVYLILMISLLSSFLFPIILLYNHRKIIFKQVMFYPVLLVFFGIIIALILNETGPRVNDGNFIWQIFVCSYILFVTCICEFLKTLKASGFNFFKFKLEIIVLTLHFLSGFAYFAKIFITNSIL